MEDTARPAHIHDMSNDTADHTPSLEAGQVLLPTTAAAVLAALAAEPGEGFIPTRFPFTYAYDFLRANPDAFGIPVELTGSRGRIAGFIREHTADDDERLKVIQAAAEAYLIHNRVVLPAGFDPTSATSVVPNTTAVPALPGGAR